MRSGVDVEVVLDAAAEVGEGPVWDAATARLTWVDITRGEVHSFDPNGGRDLRIPVGKHVGAAAPRVNGGWVLALQDGFGLLETYGQLRMIADTESDRPENRMNDGKCDSSGRFWAGTMGYQAQPDEGALYRLETDHEVVTVLKPVTLSNGLGWSPDDRVMYFIDSATQGLDAFDYDAGSGGIKRRRNVVTIPPSEGMPDGMTVDAEGFLWVALWGGGAVHRYAPDGRLDRVLVLPVRQVTSCTFGGPGLEDLYVTTAAYQLSDNDKMAQPHAGAIFRCQPGVAGLPSTRYGG